MHTIRKVLILSAEYGEGHQQAALAMKEAFMQADSSIQVEIVDYLQMVNPLLNSVTRYCLIQSVRYAPSLYGYFYNRTGKLKSSSRIQTYLNQLGIDELEQYIHDFKPDIVISTFPAPAGVMSVLKERGLTNVPTATVITDYAIHNQWIHPFTDMYFVGSEYVRRGLIARGVSEQKIYVTGIPIRSSFAAPLKKMELIQKYKLDPNLPTVLLMGGSYGVLSDITSIGEELLKFARPIQVLIVCGRNEKLYSHFQKRSDDASNLARIFGFTHKINELMAISDLIITKAGGLTVSESLAMELPMLLYRPIPGQEQQNSKFLVQSQVALLAKTRNQVSDHLHTLLQAETADILQTMKKNMKRLKKPFAANQIVDLVIRKASINDSISQRSQSLETWTSEQIW
ncbi:1,2-diacylglycerol 3-glucosyltransferase [Fodinisporobacter ferrooxydans]|uniref:1,2-diacylglycerol 3-glucosyltransferase n=1 Tax=Fodinisporobacter ferrooxydans TaxID=2901836 RepID=A0ABY4CNF8_9BACL|nr:1,2-diacylglycerol 3-glucosyltransferase [Alicyclobacillaceae bacterium MYW30-H2]